MSLSTAALLLPVFLAREFLGIDQNTPLKEVFSCALYWSWGLFGFSIFAGIVFCFLSAKWARLAWTSQWLWGIKISDSFVELGQEISYWCTPIAFLVGLALTVHFFVTFSSELNRAAPASCAL